MNRDFASDAAGATDDPGRTARADVLNVARDVEQALAARGVEVHRVEVRADDVAAALAEVRRLAPSLVFNLCESLAGDSRNEIVVPALLDLIGIPYTGSGPLALGVALDKPVAKRLLESHGIATPPARLVCSSVEIDRALDLAFPLFCKLAREDASVGVTAANVCHEEASLRRRIESLLADFRQPVLVERYIEGREIYVSILGGATPTVLGRHEIDFARMPPGCPRIVSYEGKWDPASAEYVGTQPGPCAPLALDVLARLERSALESFSALGLRDYARIDFRLAGDGTPYVIDVNPNCDLSPQAGFARAGRLAGVSYEDLVWRICEIARARASEGDAARALRPRNGRTRDGDGAAKRQAGGSATSEADTRGRRVVPARRGGVRARAH